jgi:hypothetical protein
VILSITLAQFHSQVAFILFYGRSGVANGSYFRLSENTYVEHVYSFRSGYEPACIVLLITVDCYPSHADAEVRNFETNFMRDMRAYLDKPAQQLNFILLSEGFDIAHA